MEKIRIIQKEIAGSRVYYVQRRNALGRWMYVMGLDSVPRCYGSLRQAVESTGVVSVRDMA